MLKKKTRRDEVGSTMGFTKRTGGSWDAPPQDVRQMLVSAWVLRRPLSGLRVCVCFIFFRVEVEVQMFSALDAVELWRSRGPQVERPKVVVQPPLPTEPLMCVPVIANLGPSVGLRRVREPSAPTTALNAVCRIARVRSCSV